MLSPWSPLSPSLSRQTLGIRRLGDSRDSGDINPDRLAPWGLGAVARPICRSIGLGILDLLLPKCLIGLQSAPTGRALVTGLVTDVACPEP